MIEQLPLRLDWLWFCGYDLDDAIPDHSVLSKARRRWGPEIFSDFCGQVLNQCIKAGLVEGKIVHIDSSMITANASKESIIPNLRRTGQKMYNELEAECGSLEDEVAKSNSCQDV